ncbi:hypothetical protein Zmor_009570 [Zophobas morio]|uniref:Peptidase S1 domain-containing protein n=1 Tax=Zophobas morio TaxID=2755281 RepID=A0AA38ILB5_9CUCU|nr:hypothetical protein Zmor_009570 [Zophobas morio]
MEFSLRVFVIFVIFANASTLANPVLKPLKKPEPRIINGDEASSGQFPWQAALYITRPGETTWCGGALISSRWILTAGHCVHYATHFKIALGSNSLVGVDPDRVVIDTVQYILHENYNSNTLDNDIALVMLPYAVTFNDKIQPVALSSGTLSDGTTATVSGWGLTSDSASEPSTSLNYISLTTISNSNCNRVYGELPTGAVCAQRTTSIVQSTCEGDSGGPFVTYTSSGPLHVGVVSFGHPDGCESGNPVAFARTDYYRNWIKLKTGV